ncbi:F-BAR domain only protein 2 isoform X5 [Hydra vulgaris]|uniref:F-BAR domain only protein 2 isoform X5 n=1 Tax=Hydra vulgaris TaxID=6087 RepID=A0ABM4C6G5_HYDVU
MTISPEQSPKLDDRLRISSPALIRPSGKQKTPVKFTPQKYALNNSNFQMHEEEDLIDNCENTVDKWLKGEKFDGFNILQENFKLGFGSSKEFAEFLKERCNIEETYSKSLTKLALKCSAVNSHVGTFEPCWKFLQSSTEKLANVHSQIIQNLNEVSKSLKDYSEQQKEKQKQMKEDFSSTSDAVANLQNLSSALLKAKELYEQRSQDVENCRKDFMNLKVSLKDIKSAEVKFKKSCEDYKQLVDKRENARKDFHEKMCTISQKLQTVEEYHLTQMLTILNKYGETLKVERFLLDQIIDDFSRSMITLTVEHLLENFVSIKHTGKDIPLAIDFIEVTMATNPVDIDAIATAIKEDKKKKKLEKRDKKLEKKKKKEKNLEKGQKEASSDKEGSTLQLDAEGYIIRPVDSVSINSAKLSKESNSSDSDSDSDDEGQQKLQVRIKPMEETGSMSDLSQEEFKKISAAITLMKPTPKMSPKSEEKKFVSIFSSQGKLALSQKSFSNNDLMSLQKNVETASLRSLPDESSFSAFKVEKSVSEQDLATKHEEIFQLDDHSSMDSIESKNFSTYDRVATLTDQRISDGQPPLFARKSFSNVNKDSLVSIDKSSSNKLENCNTNLNNTLTSETLFSDEFNIGTSMVGNLATNVSSTEEFANFDILRPTNEKRQPTNLPLPVFKPRPKSNQPSSISSAVPRQHSSLITNNSSLVQPVSSLSDLLDINFSPTHHSAPEKTTSQWINLESPTSNTVSVFTKNNDLSPNVSASFTVKSNFVSPKNESNSNVSSSNSIFNSSSTNICSPNSNFSSSITDVVQSKVAHNTASRSHSVPDIDKGIPIAVAFIETVNGLFKGSNVASCVVKVTGDMTISFPATIINILSTDLNPPQLSFNITGMSSLEQIYPNKALVEKEGQVFGNDSLAFKFNMKALASYLIKQSTEQGSKASYYNIDILKYQVRCNGASSLPLQLTANWQCEKEITSFKVAYKVNDTCMSSPVSLTNVSIIAPVNGEAAMVQSKPAAIWIDEQQKCIWKLSSISSDESQGSNSLFASFSVTCGPSDPAPINVQFMGEGSTISLLQFELTSPAYKLSLVKKRFATGKFLVEGS